MNMVSLAAGRVYLTIMFNICNILSVYIFDLEGIFYILGAIGVVWSIIWLVFSSNSPSENFFIKKNEIDYIEY